MPGDFCYVHSPFEDNLNYSVRQEYCFDYLRHHSKAMCKRTQQLPTVLGPAVHSGKDTPHKTFQHCCVRFGNHGTNEMLGVVGSKI